MPDLLAAEVPTDDKQSQEFLAAVPGAGMHKMFVFRGCNGQVADIISTDRKNDGSVSEYREKIIGKLLGSALTKHLPDSVRS